MIYYNHITITPHIEQYQRHANVIRLLVAIAQTTYKKVQYFNNGTTIEGINSGSKWLLMTKYNVTIYTSALIESKSSFFQHYSIVA